jgi:hypothetical protein
MKEIIAGVNEKTIDDFFQLPVWEYATNILVQRLSILRADNDDEPKIDKFRLRQGQIQEVKFMLLLHEAVKNDYLMDVKENEDESNRRIEK